MGVQEYFLSASGRPVLWICTLTFHELDGWWLRVRAVSSVAPESGTGICGRWLPGGVSRNLGGPRSNTDLVFQTDMKIPINATPRLPPHQFQSSEVFIPKCSLAEGLKQY